MILVLTLAGAGRGLAAASDMAASAFGIPGAASYICHTGTGDGSIPAGPAQHDCCDACALLASFIVPDAPLLSAPSSIIGFVEHTKAMPWVPSVARLRSPRQSQGPPAA